MSKPALTAVLRRLEDVGANLLVRVPSSESFDSNLDRLAGRHPVREEIIVDTLSKRRREPQGAEGDGLFNGGSDGGFVLCILLDGFAFG